MRLVLAGLVAVAGVLVLSSCATLNEEQCQVSDWQQLGASDGQRGAGSGFVANHQEACARFGIAVDVAAWQTGWQQGIVAYCTPSNGLSVGRSGRINPYSCPANLAGAFNEAHRIGKAVHDARSARDRVQAEIDADIARIPATPPEQLPALQLQIELKRNRLSQAQADLVRAEREADLFRLRLPYGG